MKCENFIVMSEYTYFRVDLLIVSIIVGMTYCSNFTVTVLNGEDVMLPCILPPQLTENNTVYWRFGQDIISEGENMTDLEKIDRFSLYRPYNSDWYLRVSPAMIEDEGVYICNIDDDLFLSASKLIVEFPPSIKGYDSDKVYIQVCRTARVTLFCNVTGKPRPTIKWYKRLDEGNLKYLKLNTESIFIPEVQHSNSGVILCQVSNTHGKAKLEYHISVVDLVTILETVDASQSPRSGSSLEGSSSAVILNGINANDLKTLVMSIVLYHLILYLH